MENQESSITTPEKGKDWKVFLRFYIVLGILFLVMFTMRSTVTILQVFVPDLSTTFGTTEGTTAIMFTIYNMSAALVSLFIGPISERLGYKLMLYIGMGIFAIATLLATFTTAFWMIALTQTAWAWPPGRKNQSPAPFQALPPPSRGGPCLWDRGKEHRGRCVDHWEE